MFPILTKAINLFQLSAVMSTSVGILFTRPTRFMVFGKGKFRDQLLVTEPARLLDYQTSYIFQIHLYSIFLVTDSIPVYRVTRWVQRAEKNERYVTKLQL